MASHRRSGTCMCVNVIVVIVNDDFRTTCTICHRNMQRIECSNRLVEAAMLAIYIILVAATSK